MPSLTLQAEHKLGRDEAVRRLKEKFSIARDTYGGQLGNLDEQWTDGTLSFGFKVVGMKISGTVAVEESAVKLDANLPIAAMMFKGAIEQRARAELAELLA